ncbi:hypothetical protein AcV5_010285 [Taiwanofungus camphoratus]|nr:hypothetical protein AcV5_010285 [Antrodia cinnamomea]
MRRAAQRRRRTDPASSHFETHALEVMHNRRSPKAPGDFPTGLEKALPPRRSPSNTSEHTIRMCYPDVKPSAECCSDVRLERHTTLDLEFASDSARPHTYEDCEAPRHRVRTSIKADYRFWTEWPMIGNKYSYEVAAKKCWYCHQIRKGRRPPHCLLEFNWSV